MPFDLFNAAIRKIATFVSFEIPFKVAINNNVHVTS
jgi:hypothetical protein